MQSADFRLHPVYACLDCSSDVIKTTWTLTFVFVITIRAAIPKISCVAFVYRDFWNLQLLLSWVTLWWPFWSAGKDETLHRKQSFKIVSQQLGAWQMTGKWDVWKLKVRRSTKWTSVIRRKADVVVWYVGVFWRTLQTILFELDTCGYDRQSLEFE